MRSKVRWAFTSCMLPGFAWLCAESLQYVPMNNFSRQAIDGSLGSAGCAVVVKEEKWLHYLHYLTLVSILVLHHIRRLDTHCRNKGKNFPPTKVIFSSFSLFVLEYPFRWQYPFYFSCTARDLISSNPSAVYSAVAARTQSHWSSTQAESSFFVDQ